MTILANMTTAQKAEFAAAVGGALPVLGVVTKDPNAHFALGDSRQAQQYVDPLGRTFSSVYYINQLNYRPTFNNRLRTVGNAGKSGWTSSEYLPYGLSSALASTAATVSLFGALNDICKGYTSDQVVNGYVMTSAGSSGSPGDSTAIGGMWGAMQAILNNGQRLVMLVDYPQNGVSSAVFAQFWKYRDWLLEKGRTVKNLIVVDTWPLLMNLTSNSLFTALIPALFQTDTPLTHPNMAGAMLIAAALEPRLLPVIPPIDFGQVASRLDGPIVGGDETTYRNYNWNSTFQETVAGPAYGGPGGTSGSGTLSSGTVPPGYTLAMDAGMSVALTQAAGVAGNDLTLTVTASAPGTVALLQAISMAGKTNQNPSLFGVIVQPAVGLDVAAGSSGLCGVQMEGVYQSSITAANCYGNYINAAAQYGVGPSTAYSQIIPHGRYLIPNDGGTAVQVNSRARIVFGAAGSATVVLRRFEFRPRLTL